MARIGIPGRSIGPGSDDWIAAEFERRRKWEREFAAAMPTMVRGIVSDLSSTVAALGVTQGELATAQTTLADTVDALGVTQGELTTTQATLATTVSGLSTAQADIVAAQALLTKTQSYQAETSGGFGVTSSYVTVLSRSITVPAGYSKVDLVTVGFAGAWSNSATSTYLYGLIVVNGVDGVSYLDGPVSSSGADAWASCSPSDARSLTGMSGATFAVDLRVKKLAGADWALNSASLGKLSILAIFHN